ITLVLLALSLGGLLFTLGIVPKLLSTIEKALKKVSSVVFASALTAIGINFLIGEQYLSVLLTGEAYSAQYKKVDRKSTRLNSSHVSISYAVFCWKKKRKYRQTHSVAR